MARPFAEVRANARGARFRRVKRGSLSRNHVGFFRSSDGYAYRIATISPSERYGIAKMLTFIDYEKPVSPTN